MTTIDQQIIELLKPIIASAKAKDPRINEVGLIVNADEPHADGVYTCFHGNKILSTFGEYGIESAAERVKAYDPKSEKRAEIERLKAELAALETAGK